MIEDGEWSPRICYRNGHKIEHRYDTMEYLCYSCEEVKPIKTENKMNYSTAILVMNTDARCVKVIYEPDTEHVKQTREMFKTFDKTLKVDDFVVVPTGTRFNLTVCKIVAVDVDDWMDTHKELGWVVGRVDMADANKVKAWEATAIEGLKDAEKRKRRREMQESMTQAMNEKEKEGLALMLASPMGSPVDVSVEPSKDEVA